MTQFSKWKVIGYAAAIFIAGTVSGGALGVYAAKAWLFAMPGEKEIAMRIRTHLQTQLGLTPEQMAKLDPIINNTAASLRAIHAESAQKIHAVFDDSYTKFSAVLTPEQKVKLDQMEKKRMENMQAHGMDGGWHPGHGGPRHDGDDHDGPGGPHGPGGPGGPPHGPDGPSGPGGSPGGAAGPAPSAT